MKIVIAPDSYKNCLSAPEVAQAMADGVKRVCPDAQTVLLPMADGGEGTTRAVISCTGGEICYAPCHDPLMREMQGFYGITGDGECLVVEVACASGIECLQSNELDALRATSYGTGELITSGLKRFPGVKKLLLALGGSATTDGGAGMLQALGVRFFDAQRRELAPGLGGGSLDLIASSDMSQLDLALKKCEVVIMCDVNNPLNGEHGSAAVFAPQKGASPEMVKILDANLRHFRGETAEQPGDGAAGGIAFAARTFLGGRIISGAQAVLDLAQFDLHCADADLILTGEGKSDFQTAHGKLCSVVASRSAGHPVWLISGAISDRDELKKTFGRIAAATPEQMPLAEGFRRAPELIASAVVRLWEDGL